MNSTYSNIFVSSGYTPTTRNLKPGVIASVFNYITTDTPTAHARSDRADGREKKRRRLVDDLIGDISSGGSTEDVILPESNMDVAPEMEVSSSGPVDEETQTDVPQDTTCTSSASVQTETPDIPWFSVGELRNDPDASETNDVIPPGVIPMTLLAVFLFLYTENVTCWVAGADGFFFSFLLQNEQNGSTSDRQIIERSTLWDSMDGGDSITADKGFYVQDLFADSDVTVNHPTFFRKMNRMDQQTFLQDRKIARKRVHVERVIRLAKTYKILVHPLSHTECILAYDIFFICFMLTISVRALFPTMPE